MTTIRPNVIMLAGPNGAGKTTASRTLLKDELKVTAFVNADIIAQGLAGFDPESAALPTGAVKVTAFSYTIFGFRARTWPCDVWQTACSKGGITFQKKRCGIVIAKAFAIYFVCTCRSPIPGTCTSTNCRDCLN